jgi:IclR family transcriptional regulator, acetate operon repressor
MRKQVSRTESTSSVGTLARGLDILELFAGESPELTQKEISERLGLPVPTVHRLTKLLAERGWLVRDAGSRRLRLGLGVARLLPALLSGLRLPELARDHLRGMAERTGETVNLAVLHGGEVVYLLSESGSRLLTLRSTIGLRLPVHCTALGKCLLAQLPDDDARRTAGPEPYAALAPRTITSWADLQASLEKVRRQGVAVSHEEYEVGLDSIAIPLAWVEGEGPAAVNVSLPSSRAIGPAGTELTRELRAVGRAIESDAGIHGRAGAAA